MLSKKIQYPFFLFLFPVFFVFHGFTENFYFVSVKSALLLTGTYIISSLVLTGIFYFFSKRLHPAALMAAFVMFFHFFFGSIHDRIKEYAGNSVFAKYSFVVGAFLVLTVILFFILKRRKQFSRLTQYLNILFLALILIDLYSLVVQSITNKKKLTLSRLSATNNACNTCSKPDIYIIMLDGYAGSDQLKNILFYNNSPFTDSLALRGFRTIPNSNSNYDSSPSSVASLLNMEYLDSTEARNMRQKGHIYAFTRINNNRLMSFLQANGYTVFNYSIFKVAGQASLTGGSFVPANAKLINGNTFISRLEKDVLLNVATKLNLKWYLKKSLYATHKENEKLFTLTMKIPAVKTNGPKVIYTHLMMPHHPYYFDENGVARSFEELKKMALSDTSAYLSYLKYTNKKIIQLVDHILLNSASPPVIAILSDHGFRYFAGSYTKYAFSNIMSICLPGRDYSLFKDSMTNVNFFSTFLNTTFHQSIPMQKDSTSVIDF